MVRSIGAPIHRHTHLCDIRIDTRLLNDNNRHSVFQKHPSVRSRVFLIPRSRNLFASFAMPT